MDFLEQPISVSGPEWDVLPFEAGVAIPGPSGISTIWLTNAAKRFHGDERGVSLVEYALLFALITVVCLSIMSALGTAISSFFGAASTSI
jgi:Flp pilus assembly pilin Flp